MPSSKSRARLKPSSVPFGMRGISPTQTPSRSRLSASEADSKGPSANRQAAGAGAHMLRRFPPPWSVEELGACYVVRDHNGQQLAYVYFEDEPGRRSAAKLLAKDEARRDGGEDR